MKRICNGAGDDIREALPDFFNSGKYCFGKPPMQTFLDSIPLAKDKLLGDTVQAVA